MIDILNKAWRTRRRRRNGLKVCFYWKHKATKQNGWRFSDEQWCAYKNDINEFLAQTFHHLYRGDQVLHPLFSQQCINQSSWTSLWWMCICLKMPVWRSRSTGDTPYTRMCWPRNLQVDVVLIFLILYLGDFTFSWADVYCISRTRHMQSIAFLLCIYWMRYHF